MAKKCVFCEIVGGALEAEWIVPPAQMQIGAGDDVVAFLDNRPLFPGHVLIVPRVHYETILDLPPTLDSALLSTGRRIARALESGLGADGFFMAMNNRISQSVPHLHLHVIPRRKKDGLKGFFWPRYKYTGPDEIADVRRRIIEALPPDGASA